MAGVRTKINLKKNSIPSSMIKVVDHHQDEAGAGIVTILRSGSEGTKAAASIRKTLSADMSSKKWLEHNGFIINKIVSSSSDHSSSSSSSEDEEEEAPGQDDVWRSIQAEKEKKKKKGDDVWGTIQTNNILSGQKQSTSDGDGSSGDALPPPYVHPLVKRSASTLSEKSLEICTESLGSETGSDCFSSEIINDDEDTTKNKNRGVVVTEKEPLLLLIKDEEEQGKKNLAKYKKSPVRPFPPPLASIGDGAALHMQSHRQNGRLVVEAVSVPPRNYFHSQRTDGRLVLTLIHPPVLVPEDEEEEEENRVDAFENVFGDIEEDVPVEDDGGGAEEQPLSVVSLASGGMMSVTKTGLVMKKLMNMNMNMNPKKTGEEEEEEEAEQVFPIPQSLPPRVVAPLIAPPSSFNAYDYFWRKTTVVAAHPKKHHRQDLAVLKKEEEKKTEYSVPAAYIRGCKEARMRSLLIWDSYCVATS